MTQTLSRLIKQYQRNLKMRDKIMNKVQEAEQTRAKWANEYNHMSKECDQIKTLIDWCIHSGESPVEAKLKHNMDQIQSELIKSSRKHRLNPNPDLGVSHIYDATFGHSHTVSAPHSHTMMTPSTLSAVGSHDVIITLSDHHTVNGSDHN